MKKLIAISVVFALVAGAAFAADVSGAVIGTVNVLEGSTAKNRNGDTPVLGGGAMDRMRIEASGENDDGTFGGWLRLDPTSLNWEKDKVEGKDNPKKGLVNGFGSGVQGIAWWKPIDVFKFSIGGNDDGMFGKEDNVAWGFCGPVSDSGVAFNGDNVWSGSGRYGYGLVTRNAFYGGFAGHGAILNISPAEIVDINIAIPFIDGDVIDGKNSKALDGAHEAADYFKAAHAQLDFKLDFGNIAITYSGGPRYYEYGDGSVIFGYFGLRSIENLTIDVGIGFEMANQGEPKSNPIAVGAGATYSMDSFGVKFRTVARFGGEFMEKGAKYDAPLVIIADLLPYFNISDDMRAYVGIGIGTLIPDEGDSVLGWSFNPYLEVGPYWGSKFAAGIKVMSNGVEDANGKKTVDWSVPIALIISF